MGDMEARLGQLQAEVAQLHRMVSDQGAADAARQRAEQYRMSLLGAQELAPDIATQLRRYKNLVFNSSFERGSVGSMPEYWTGGVISADAAWYGTYSLKLAPGESAEQTAPAYVLPGWTGTSKLRVAFNHKFGKIKVELLAEGGQVRATHEYGRAGDWPDGRREFTVDVGSTEIKVFLRFTNMEAAGGQDLYLDAVQLEPDLGKGASLYSDGPYSFPEQVSGGGTTTGAEMEVLVAAANATAAEKARAFRVCDGYNDNAKIAEAISYVVANGGGGRVLLSRGVFYTSNVIAIQVGVRLEGVTAASTTIKLMDQVYAAPAVAPTCTLRAADSTLTPGQHTFCFRYRLLPGGFTAISTDINTTVSVQAGQVIDITDGGMTWRKNVTGILVYEYRGTGIAQGWYLRGEITAPGGVVTITTDITDLGFGSSTEPMLGMPSRCVRLIGRGSSICRVKIDGNEQENNWASSGIDVIGLESSAVTTWGDQLVQDVEITGFPYIGLKCVEAQVERSRFTDCGTGAWLTAGSFKECRAERCTDIGLMIESGPIEHSTAINCGTGLYASAGVIVGCYAGFNTYGIMQAQSSPGNKFLCMAINCQLEVNVECGIYGGNALGNLVIGGKRGIEVFDGTALANVIRAPTELGIRANFGGRVAHNIIWGDQLEDVPPVIGIVVNGGDGTIVSNNSVRFLHTGIRVVEAEEIVVGNNYVGQCGTETTPAVELYKAYVVTVTNNRIASAFSFVIGLKIGGWPPNYGYHLVTGNDFLLDHWADGGPAISIVEDANLHTCYGAGNRLADGTWHIGPG